MLTVSLNHKLNWAYDFVVCEKPLVKWRLTFHFHIEMYSVYQNDWSCFKRPWRLWKCTQKHVSHMERNGRYSSSDRMRNPTLSLGPWRYEGKMATQEQKAFCVLQFATMNQLFLLSRASGDNFSVIPHLPTALGVGISSFRQRGDFVKGKKCRTSACVRRKCGTMRQIFLRSQKKSVLQASRELQMSTMSEWRRCERDWKWSPVVFSWLQLLQSFWYTVYFALLLCSYFALYIN
jgi:hypothetical protein